MVINNPYVPVQKSVQARKKFLNQVFFATSSQFEYESDAAKESRLYESTARALERVVGVKTFLPHRDAASQTSAPLLYEELFRNIVQSDLVIADIATPSYEVGAMIAESHSNDVPILPFYRADRKPAERVLEYSTQHFDPIIIRNNVQGIRDIVSAVRRAYGR